MLSTISSFQSQIEAKIPNQIAFIYAFIAQTSLVIGHSLAQFLSKSLTPVQVIYFSGIQGAIFNYLILQYQNQSTFAKNPKTNKMLLFRGFVWFIGSFFVSSSLAYMPLSESIVLQMTSPVFTGLLAFLFLGEKYDKILILTTIFSLFGIVLISKPEFLFGANSEKEAAIYPYRSLGVLFTLIGAFITAVVQIILKKLGSVSNASTSGFYWGIGLAMSAPLVQLFQGTRTFYLGLFTWLFLLAIFRYLSQIYLHKGFTLGEANKVSLISYFQVPLAYIIDVFILGVAVDFYSVVGSICVFSCVFVMLYKNYRDLKEKNAKKVNFTQ